MSSMLFASLKACKSVAKRMVDTGLSTLPSLLVISAYLTNFGNLLNIQPNELSYIKLPGPAARVLVSCPREC